MLSSRRTAEAPARGLAPLPDEQQEFALHWTGVIQKSNSEMAYQFVSRVPRALALMGVRGTRAWLLKAMDVYDKEGLYPGSAVLRGIEEFAREYRLSPVSVTLDEVRIVLERFIRGLSGRDLKLEAGKRSYTDTETLYLPARINRFDSREKNYRLYKATAVCLWAQSWFGTFRRPGADAPHLVQHIAGFDDYDRALELFNLLETRRLRACIERELPGLIPEMQTLGAIPPVRDATWRHHIKALESPDATVADTLAATAALYPLETAWPEGLPYQGALDLEAARLVTERRLVAEKSRLQRGLSDLLAAGENRRDGDPAAQSGDNAFEIDDTDGADLTFKLDGEAVAVPPEMGRALSSLFRDLGRLPPEWLTPGGDGPEHDYHGSDGERSKAAEDVWKGTYHEEGAFPYDEWISAELRSSADIFSAKLPEALVRVAGSGGPSGV